MPDFDALAHDAEDAAKSHGQQVDQGLDKIDKEADARAGGDDHGLIDKGEKAAEHQLGTDQAPTGAAPPAGPATTEAPPDGPPPAPAGQP